MSTNFGGVKALTVATGDTKSNIISYKEAQDSYIVGLFGQSSQGGKTLTIEVSRDLVPTAGGNWYVLQDGFPSLSDVPVPAQNKACFYPQLAACSFRLAISSAHSSDIVLEVSKSFYAPGGM